MEFFQRVNIVFSQNKAAHFPDEGIAFLERPPKGAPHLEDFHKKLVPLIKSLIPTESDALLRQKIIDKIKARITKIFGESVIFLPCGSCMNGTFLPNADIDFTIFFYPMPCNPVRIMEILQVNLADLSMDGNFLPILTAHVAVLKFTTYPGIPIDIGIDDIHGPLSVCAIKNIFKEFPCLLPTQLFFKSILQIKGLDAPYTGGIGSYTLQMMLLAYIQFKGVPDNIIEMVVGFCYFYGNVFNFTLTGIRVANEGSFFSRAEENKLSPTTPGSLCIIDPLNSNNILGHNAFKMDEVREELKIMHLLIVKGRYEEIIRLLTNQIIEFDKKREESLKCLSMEGEKQQPHIPI